ncbi:nSTAND1 domain-containing NTPase [Lentzea cavernae]|uniref:Novel STAND NTPase 1 domain-containing protein n=1 Tax=Lentzea cavernae TaxID=2020703 RepID=A0ABQ3MCZ0_9PSEU|nr:helix-turn-helix domain-containing protein [Lentzea cavernae]GHH34695.1 hypothetical protein GCM10017774_19080 [Lentzea cavernae]
MPEEYPLELDQVSTPQDFGAALTRLRHWAGLSIRELAKESGVASGTLGSYSSGRHLPRDANVLRDVLRACGVEDPLPVRQWVDCLLRVRAPLGKPSRSGTPPYRGLDAFELEDREWFFGRTALTDRLVMTTTDPDTTGPVVVVGPSGSGKSSLMRAGVAGRLANSEPGWQLALLKPGPDPMAALAEQVALLSDETDPLTERSDLPLLIAAVLEQRQASVLVLVDQLEELFTHDIDAAGRSEFVAALHSISAITSGSHRVQVLASLRSDFYDAALQLPQLRESLQARQVLVGAMTQGELQTAITGPAAKAGVTIDGGLVHLILRDLAPSHGMSGHGAGALPMLSYALLATWKRSSSKRMTVQNYVDAGGINGAIAHSAEAVFSELMHYEQGIARQQFVRLVHVSYDAPDTRRRVRLSELVGGEDESLHGRRKAVLRRYVDARLVTADFDFVEISHEALLSAWPRLRKWIDEDRAGHRIRASLTTDTTRWHDADEDPGMLYRGQRLATALEWRDSAGAEHRLSGLELRFLEHCTAAADAERFRERRNNRVLRVLVSVLTVLALVAAGAATWSFVERARANHARELAVSRQIAGTADRLRETDPALAAQLAVAALRVAPTVEARSALVTATTIPIGTRLPRPSGGKQSMAVSPDGTLLAAAGATNIDADLLLWDLGTAGTNRAAPNPLKGHSSGIYAVTFSPDGQLVATASDDRTVRLWDVRDRQRPVQLGVPLVGPSDRLLSVEFSPDGRMLAAGTRNAELWMWDVTDREQVSRLAGPVRVGGEALQSVAFHPTSPLLAVADAKRAVHLWRVEGGLLGDRLPSIPLPTKVNVVAFRPSTGELVAGGNDAILRFWDVSAPESPRPAAEPLAVAAGWINAVAFDGDVVAVASADHKVHAWDLATRTELVVLPHPEPMTGVALRGKHTLITSGADGVARVWPFPSPSIPGSGRKTTGVTFDGKGRMIADAGVDVRFWDLGAGRTPSRLAGPLPLPPGVTAMAGLAEIDDDSTLFASSARDTFDVWLWDIRDPAKPRLQPQPLRAHTALVEAVVFSPTRRLLATGGDDGRIALWDVADPSNPRRHALLEPNARNVFTIVFSPDGGTIAAATQSGRLLRWDVSNPDAPRELEPVVVSSDYLYSVDYTSDSSLMAAGTATGAVQLYSVDGQQRMAKLGEPITGPDGYVHSVAFSPDNRTLAAGTSTGQVWLWDITDRTAPTVTALVQGATEGTWKVTFSPDGRSLATVLGNVTAVLDPDPDRVVRTICESAGLLITREEWRKHVPGEEYRAIC